MRDGVRLATDVHLPPGAGPFPVVLERTPYGRAETSRSELTAADPVPASRAELAATFTARGYAVVYQDCRGRYGSEGVFVKYLSDGHDGVDTCAWLREQPWCDGRICTMGLSYSAHTQAALGCLDPPGLVAQVLDCGGFSNAWEGGIRQFGAFELKQATWALKQALLSPEAEADPVLRAALAAEDIKDWFTRMPWRRRPLAAAPPPRLRGLPARAVVAGPVQRLLAAARHLRGRLLRDLQPGRLRPPFLLVRPLRLYRDAELSRPEARRPRQATPHSRPLDAWRPQPELVRRRRVRPRVDAR